MKNQITSYPSYSTQDVEVISQQKSYDGFFKIISYQLRHKLFNGQWSGEIRRELFERGHACALLPYDPVRDEVVLIEQFRIGALTRTASPWLLELIAGVVEEGESNEQVVRREAKEEADLTILRSELLCCYLSSAGGSSERLQLFIGEVDASQAGGIFGLAQEDEDIKVHVFSREQALLMLEQGVIDNAASIIALQWLALNGEKLRKKWLKLADLED